MVVTYNNCTGFVNETLPNDRYANGFFVFKGLDSAVKCIKTDFVQIMSTMNEQPVGK